MRLTLSHTAGSGIRARLCFFILLLLSLHPSGQAQERFELLPFGDMDQWINRRIPESSLIGGNVRSVYAVGPRQTVEGAIAYTPIGGSPWATSNVMAKVVGVVKTNTSVFPERRGKGFCARLDTHLERIKVLGLVDMTVLAAGSLFLGEVHEPITGTKDPDAKLAVGMPFTRRPAALRFDYKIRLADSDTRVRATGFSRVSDIEGRDYPTLILLLQKRWEDAEGHIYARRIGTIVHRYHTATADWQEQATYPIQYGDITHRPDYDEGTMGLQAFDNYAVNSRGESVPIQEVGWGTPDDTPTHLIVQFTSSHEGAYVGSPGNSFWIDNIGLVYR